MNFIGCATPPIVSYSISDIPIAKQSIDADLRSLVIRFAPDAILKNIQSLYVTTDSEIFFNWQTSLQDSINRGRYFNDNSNNKIEILVVVKTMKRTNIAPFVAMTAEIEARYDTVDRKSNNVINSKTIKSSGISNYAESSNGIYRSNEAMSRAVKKNIIEYLEFLRNAN